MTRHTARFLIGSSVLVALLGVAPPSALAQSVTISQPVDPGCLACVATRQSTAAEWAEALAATASIKARPDDVRVAAAARAASAPHPRTSLERMRETAERTYGEDLSHLSSLAARIDRDAQTYLSTCYGRYAIASGQSAALGPAGALALSVPPPPTEAGRLEARRAPAPLASVFELSSGTPIFLWSETWTPMGLTGGESLVPCDGMWRDLNAGGTAVKAALDLIETDARANDVYPGVVRELFAAYGLNRSAR